MPLDASACSIYNLWREMRSYEKGIPNVLQMPIFVNLRNHRVVWLQTSIYTPPLKVLRFRAENYRLAISVQPHSPCELHLLSNQEGGEHRSIWAEKKISGVSIAD